MGEEPQTWNLFIHISWVCHGAGKLLLFSFRLSALNVQEHVSVRPLLLPRNAHLSDTRVSSKKNKRFIYIYDFFFFFFSVATFV